MEAGSQQASHPIVYSMYLHLKYICEHFMNDDPQVVEMLMGAG